MTSKIYAGIGSRQTPQDILTIMNQGANQLFSEGWLLRSGHADGADLAFEIGSSGASEIHLPWWSYNKEYPHKFGKYIVPEITQEMVDIAAAHHPVWDKLSEPVQKLMCRNVSIILGSDLETHANMVICWTPEGKGSGGTGHGIRVAKAYGIPVFDLGLKGGITMLSKYLWY